MTRPVRRNLAHSSAAEQQAYINAVLAADLSTYSDGVSYWDKQDQIHQGTHNHGGNSFIPWHRELCNRYEALLQQSNPDLALHYWDWTEDPRAASDGAGGTVNLLSSTLLGTGSGLMDGPLASLHNGGTFAGSRNDTGDPADPPQSITRACVPGAPGVDSDTNNLTSANGLPQAQQWTTFRQAVESSHNSAHGFFGVGSSIGNAHTSFEDPFVYLLHSNVDRLFAMWQAEPGQEWRLDPNQVYGDQSGTTGEGGILAPLQPWDGTVEFGAPIEPWVGSSPQIEVKTCRDPSVVAPPCYDTLPLTIDQVAPNPGDPIRFLDVVEFLPTARALRLRVHGCESVTVSSAVTGPFSLLTASVTAPDPGAFGEQDLLVWVLFTPGAAGSVGSGTLTATASTGDVFSIPITATVVPNPSVGTSLVLDRSGSMSEPSGLPGKDRMAVLHDSAPLFVSLLDAADGVGVVRFDTDAVEATPVADAGPMIGGLGRLNASSAVASTTTNPAGLTAIGDGLEAAAAQLTPAAANYDTTATILFTDGHETADKTIAAAASSVNSRVFAIGLGTADQLNPGALSDIANGTGGYLLLTGNAGIDDQLLLQKYFAQVLAGATNAAIVVDPSGFVSVGGKVTVPFLLTDADIRADVLVLGEMASALRVEIVAPDGTTLTAGAGADEVTGDSYRVLRVVPSTVLTPPSAAGVWKIVLSVDGTGLDILLGRLRERLSRLENKERAAQLLRQIEISIKVHGVPYTVSVQARSGLMMRAEVSQQSRLPGTQGRVRVFLTDSGIPLDHSALVVARVTDPGGATQVVPMPRTGEGEYGAMIDTTVSGVYPVLISALGTDLRGTAFTREELRTIAVWARGDEPPPEVINPGGEGGTHLDTCELLLCMLKDKGVRAFLERQQIDADALGRCVKRACG
jgi:Common central domain of tyrosinase/von Willebrand factor type A domain